MVFFWIKLDLGSKNFLILVKTEYFDQKKFRPRKILTKKYFGKNKFLAKMISRPKKILCQKEFGLENLLS